LALLLLAVTGSLVAVAAATPVGAASSPLKFSLRVALNTHFETTVSLCTDEEEDA